MHPRRLFATLLAAVALLAAMVWWHERRIVDDAIADLSREQRTLAVAIASTLAERLAADGAIRDDEVASTVSALEGCDGCVVVVRPPGSPRVVGRDGVARPAAALVRAIDDGKAAIVLARADAQSLGLARDTAVAGLATTVAADGNRWGLAVVGGAHRNHDPTAWARARAAALVAFISLVLSVFAGIATWHWRREHRFLRLLADASRKSRRADQIAREMIGQVQRFAGAVVDTVRSSEAPPPSMRLVPAAVVLGDACRATAAAFTSAGVALQVRGTELEARLIADRKLLAQALGDLLAAACDASARGGEVAFRLAERGAEVVFEIDATSAPSSTRDARDPASRLRLVLADPVARLHRGALAVRTDDAGGLHATLTLPAVAAAGGPL